MAKVSLALLATGLGLVVSTLAANCQNSPGVANGQCVKFFSGYNGEGALEGSYKPTCQGNCYRYGFNSIRVAGDGTYGTNCNAYSDNNCQNYIGQTGNELSTFARTTTTNFPGGQSMKCYYRC
jgi:hypothetical protein